MTGAAGAMGATGATGGTGVIPGDWSAPLDVSPVAGATAPSLVLPGSGTSAWFVFGFATGVGITGAVVTCAPSGRIGRQKNADARTKRVTSASYSQKRANMQITP